MESGSALKVVIRAGGAARRWIVAEGPVGGASWAIRGMHNSPTRAVKRVLVAMWALRLDHPSVRQFHQRTQHSGQTALGASTGAADDVARFDKIARPAVGLEMIQAHHLDGPLLHVALIVFDVEINECVRIGPF